MNYPGTDLTVAEVQQDKILVIGEKIGIRRFERIAEGYNVTYVHMGGNIGVLVNMDVSDNISDSETVKELGKDVAMQIAAMRPRHSMLMRLTRRPLKRKRESSWPRHCRKASLRL